MSILTAPADITAVRNCMLCNMAAILRIVIFVTIRRIYVISYDVPMHPIRVILILQTVIGITVWRAAACGSRKIFDRIPFSFLYKCKNAVDKEAGCRYNNKRTSKNLFFEVGCGTKPHKIHLLFFSDFKTEGFRGYHNKMEFLHYGRRSVSTNNIRIRSHLQ